MIEGDAGNYAQVGVHVYSSKDLYDWKDEGIALRVSADPKSDIAKGCILERPKVIYNRKTGKFVMWFHLETKGKGYGAARSGVAIADQPTGPYRFIESFRPNAGAWPINVPDELKKPLSAEEDAYVRKLHLRGGPVPNFPENLIFRRDHAGGQMARDMTLFVDDDGTAFHIYASEDNGTLQISQLTEDYLRPAGKYVRVFPGRLQRGPGRLQARRQVLPDYFRLHGLGPQHGSAGRGRFDLGAVEGPGQSLYRQGCRLDLPWAEHVCLAGARQGRGVHLHGGSVAAQQRDRRPASMAADPVQGWQAVRRVDEQMGSKLLRTVADSRGADYAQRQTEVASSRSVRRGVQARPA